MSAEQYGTKLLEEVQEESLEEVSGGLPVTIVSFASSATLSSVSQDHHPTPILPL